MTASLPRGITRELALAFKGVTMRRGVKEKIPELILKPQSFWD